MRKHIFFLILMPSLLFGEMGGEKITGGRLIQIRFPMIHHADEWETGAWSVNLSVKIDKNGKVADRELLLESVPHALDSEVVKKHMKEGRMKFIASIGVALDGWQFTPIRGEDGAITNDTWLPLKFTFSKNKVGLVKTEVYVGGLLVGCDNPACFMP